jgi:hypothetical protein
MMKKTHLTFCLLLLTFALTAFDSNLSPQELLDFSTKLEQILKKEITGQYYLANEYSRIITEDIFLNGDSFRYLMKANREENSLSIVVEGTLLSFYKQNDETYMLKTLESFTLTEEYLKQD